jgi:uncharacterized protein YdeI (YjbR/CyaY-like superfamily)
MTAKVVCESVYIDSIEAKSAMIDTMKDYDVRGFADQASFRQWLHECHDSADGLWLQIYKKASGVATVTYAQALDEALCYGWIDGQTKSYDELSFLQKFTPRRSRSMWSKRNIEHIARLTAEGKMTPSGQAEVARAQADGRWAAAYDTPTDMKVPDDFLQELEKYPAAKEFFATLNKADLYAIAWRLQTVKTVAGRQRRMDAMLEMLRNGKKFH